MLSATAESYGAGSANGFCRIGSPDKLETYPTDATSICQKPLAHLWRGEGIINEAPARGEFSPGSGVRERGIGWGYPEPRSPYTYGCTFRPDQVCDLLPVRPPPILSLTGLRSLVISG